MPIKTGGVTPQPPSIEKRLPLALALMMLVLLVSQYIFKPVPGPKPVAPVNDKAAAKLAEKPAVSATIPAAPATTPAGQVQAGSEITTTIDTNLYHIVFTNRGAAIKSWVLKKYQDNEGKPLQLINTASKDIPLPFMIEALDRKLDIDPNTVLYQPKLLADGAGVEYTFSDGK